MFILFKISFNYWHRVLSIFLFKFFFWQIRFNLFFSKIFLQLLFDISVLLLLGVNFLGGFTWAKWEIQFSHIIFPSFLRVMMIFFFTMLIFVSFNIFRSLIFFFILTPIFVFMFILATFTFSTFQVFYLILTNFCFKFLFRWLLLIFHN